jgi:flagellar biosynthetic protein FlhB
MKMDTDLALTTVKLNLQLFAEEKTEAATPHKREEVRKEGQVAKSGEIGTTLIILVGFYVIKAALTFAIERIYNLARHILSQAAAWNGTADYVYSLYLLVLKEALIVVLPVFAALFVVGFAAQAVQVGFMFNLNLIKPQFNRINPLEGFKRLFSKRALVEFLKSVLKIAVVGWIVYSQVRQRIPWLANLASVDITHSFLLISNSVFSVVQMIGMTLLILAVTDYFYQRWEFEKNIRMTKQEIKEEFKQTEGDPLIRSRIRQKQREIASRRMMQAVPTADVVITNPTHYAVALLYQADKMAAPEVVAKGAGLIALKIRETAEEHGVPTVENPPLARSLYKSVEIGQQIPAELYPAVAEVLAFVYRLKNRAL